MINDFRTAATANPRSTWLVLFAAIIVFVIAVNAGAQAPAAPSGAAPPPSAEELDKLVGPIALYPDDLVAIILPASTNPLQLVQADRFLDKRKSDPKLPLDDRWDDPVKSLLNYPDVVKMMSADLDWTTALGEAVVADQGAVIEAVQAFRRKAKAAGNLKSDDKQVVRVEKEIVYIEPADPQVIYVPQYNPSTVVVQSAVPAYAYYPTPYPSYYYPYPPGAALATGIIWGAAIGAAWSGNHYGCCGDTNINVNRNTNINSGNRNTARQQPAGGGSAWKSNKQPGQVSGSVGRSASNTRPGDARGGAAGGAGRASAQPTGAGRGAGSGGDAFGGYGSGRQAQMDSSRGASSRSSASSAGVRASPSSSGASRSMSSGGGGGARAGGGGGGARAGGGGGGGRGGGGGGRGGGGRR